MSFFNESKVKEGLNEEQLLPLKSSFVSNSEQFTSKIGKKFQELEAFFHASTKSYQEEIQSFNQQIGLLKDEISLLKKKNSLEEEELYRVTLKLKEEIGSLEQFNQEFNEKIRSIEELKHEYKEMMDERVHKILFGRKKREILEIVDKIEELELTILNSELRRINLFENVEPKQVAIMELEKNLKELKLKKEHFELTGLEKKSFIRDTNSMLQEVVETEIMETINTKNEA